MKTIKILLLIVLVLLLGNIGLSIYALKKRGTAGGYQNLSETSTMSSRFNSAHVVNAGKVLPQPLKMVKAEYPEELKKRNIQGRVFLKCVVNVKGEPEKISVVRSSGHQELDSLAIEALKKWRFTPGEIKGKPSPMEVVVPFDFKLMGG